jgi:hypothetical protein
MTARKVAGYVPMTEELRAEGAQAVAMWQRMYDRLAEDLDRQVRPWLYPDPNPMPVLVPFPWLARITDLWGHRP